MPKFGDASKHNLSTAEWALQEVFKEVIKHRDCSVLCGHRNMPDQNTAFETGVSEVRFPNSKHNHLPSQAVDVVPYPINWADKEGFIEFAGFVLGVASQKGIKLRWGGHFKDFFDGPHFELMRER